MSKDTDRTASAERSREERNRAEEEAVTLLTPKCGEVMRQSLSVL